MPGDDVTIEVNGRVADQAAVSLLHHEGWGHFTAMQVRGGPGARPGFAPIAAGSGPPGNIRASDRRARGVRPHPACPGPPLDASVRVYGYWAGLIVTVREPQETPRPPHSITCGAVPVAAGPAQARRQLGPGPVRQTAAGGGL